MLTQKDILHYGSIVAFKIFKENERYLTADGLGSDKVFFDDYHQVPNKIFSKSQFLVLPTFRNENKSEIAHIAEYLKDKNTDSKYKRCADLILNLLSEYNSNIEVIETNLTTPITFNLMTFQLLHLNSSKFLAINEDDHLGDSAKLYLVEVPSLKTEFKLVNSLKYQIEGECLVYFNNPVYLASVKEIQGVQPQLQVTTHSSFVITEPSLSIEGGTNLEVVYMKQEVDEIKGENLRGGDLIMIAQLDHNLMIQVENDLELRVKNFADFNIYDEEFSLGLLDFSSKEYLESISFTNSIWIVEHVKKSDQSVLHWKDRVRLLSLPAEKYLCIELNTSQPYFYLDKLTEANIQSSEFMFVSPTASGENISLPIKSNDYLSLKTAHSNLYVGIAVQDKGVSFALEALTKQKNENTFKIMKNDHSSNEISYFQISTFRYLSELLQELKQYRITRAYRESQILRKQIYPAIRLINKLREFVNNQYLIASVKDKYGQRNSARQTFLAKQKYIYFCSMILSDIMDQHEIKVLEELDEEDPKNQGLVEALNNKTDLEKLISTANFKQKASNKITEDDIMANFLELLKSKVLLANALYLLLQDISDKHQENQEMCYECSYMITHQFSALPFCSQFMGYLINSNEANNAKLSSNLNFGRINQSMPHKDKLKVDILISDPNNLMTENFKEIQPELMAATLKPTERRRQMNPLIYTCMLVVNSKSDKIRLKCIKFLSEIASINHEPCKATQEQIYRLTVLIPELKNRLFSEFKM
jgi:hypothetical protein